MKILAVDDEKKALENLIEAITVSAPNAEVFGFRKAAEALEYVVKEGADVAFLDIQMRDMDGITLAKKIKGVNPRINIVFTTGNDEFIFSAMQLHPNLELRFFVR